MKIRKRNSKSICNNIGSRRSMKKLIFVCLILFLQNITYSNGGPSGFSLESSGNVSLLKVPGMHLLSERIIITPIKDEITVNVTYILNNQGLAQDVKYGFPFYNSDYKSAMNNDSYVSFEYGDEYRMVKDFTLSLNSKKVKLTEKLDKDSVTKNETLWYLSTLPMKKGKNVITVSYKATPYYVDWSTNKDPKVEYSDRVFIYNLEPAKGWGKGILPKLEVNIDLTYIQNRKGAYSIDGLDGFKKKGKFFTTMLNDLDLKKKQKIKLTYNNSKYFNYLESYGYKLTEIKGVKKISASSTAKGSYQVENLLDQNTSTAWVEGKEGQGIGEWVEIEFEAYSNIKALFLANGYLKSENTLFQNSMVKKLKLDLVLLKGSTKKKYSKIIDIRKLSDYKRLALPLPPASKQEFSGFHELSKDYRTVLFSPDDVDYLYSIQKVKLTILEVHPGTKYEDTCISEICAF